MTEKKRGRGWTLAGIVLLAAALLLTGYNLASDLRAGRSAQAVLPGIAAAPRADSPVPDYLLTPGMEMPTCLVDGQRYVGTVSVPALELTLPVAAEWSYPQLRQTPCRYSGTAYAGNLVIAAHNYTRHFGRLKALSPGDEVVFTDVDGHVFRYQVAELETLASTAVEDMTDSGWELTLFTCTVGGQARVAVRCRAAG